MEFFLFLLLLVSLLFSFHYFFQKTANERKDLSYSSSVKNFHVVKKNTPCLFAKSSVLWGADGWDIALSLEENLSVHCIPALNEFTRLCEQKHLDGFVIEIPAIEYGCTLDVFAMTVRRVLTFLSDQDPSGWNCMKHKVDAIGWVFSFSSCQFFVTTFGPCYGEDSPRYSFGSHSTFILLQPYLSFFYHNLEPDPGFTNWKDPKSIRDRIRKNFRNQGKIYEIPDRPKYVIAKDIVRPLHPGEAWVQWWSPFQETKI